MTLGAGWRRNQRAMTHGASWRHGQRAMTRMVRVGGAADAR